MEYVSRMIGEVPEKLSRFSEDISGALHLMSTMSGEMQSSALGVQNIQQESEGCQQSPINC